MSYSRLSTKPAGGDSPGRLGGIGPTSISIGPGGQFSVSTASNATATSIWDQILNWMGESTVIAGVPNSLIAIGLGIGVIGMRRH